jgi:hypothetical protein
MVLKTLYLQKNFEQIISRTKTLEILKHNMFLYYKKKNVIFITIIRLLFIFPVLLID